MPTNTLTLRSFKAVSHFQLDGFTTFARGARAILDADRNLFRGRHQRALREVFRKRGVGPVE